MINIKEYFGQEKEKLRQAGLERLKANKRVPYLRIIDATDQDAANQIYIKKKIEDFNDIGWETQLIRPDSSRELEQILKYGTEPLIVQMPISKIFQSADIQIKPQLDCDGITPNALVMPATVRGIIDYLDACGFEYSGKTAVVLGRSQIVGKPMAKALLDRDMTVSVCHSKTSQINLHRLTKTADLVICATGVPGLLHRQDCKFATVIDVGITRGEDGKLHGDFIEDESYCVTPEIWSTPVPGGVGLLTRLGLMKNCLELTEKLDTHII